MFERGDLLLVPFPFSDLSASKRRPVLALTTPESYGDFIALAVTSRPQAEHGVPINAPDMARGMLPTSSWIRVDRVVTLNASLVVKTTGHVTDDILSEAVQRFCNFISHGK